MANQYRPIWWRPWLETGPLLRSDLQPADSAPPPEEPLAPEDDVRGDLFDTTPPEEVPSSS
jgi:hypothetical protein